MKKILDKVKQAFGTIMEEPATEEVVKAAPAEDLTRFQNPYSNAGVNELIPEPATIRGIRASADKPIQDLVVNKSIPQTKPMRPKKESVLPPASRKREEILRFIIHGLKPYINEKNTGIKGIRFFVHCNSKEEENLLFVALYGDRPNFFQQEFVQRKLSDHYLVPDQHWFFEFSIQGNGLPDCQVMEGTFGMDIIKNASEDVKFIIARIRILSGQAEKTDYILDPAVKLKYAIGRGHHPALPSGKLHSNDIVLLDKDDPGFTENPGRANLSVSRFHALIVFDARQKKYFICADKGGTPDSGNKTKLFSENGRMTRLDIPGAMHVMQSGDQVELGGTVRLQFELEPNR